MPGYAKCFDDIFNSNIALQIARHTGSAAAILQAGEKGLTLILRQADVQFQRPTLAKILAWAKAAPSAPEYSHIHQYIWIALENDRSAKIREIAAVERDLAALLVATPYVLLLSFPGINVVSAAEFAGEMGPITHYANAGHITGRAGLFPSRYQSAQVDHRDGPLVRRANRSLRQAIMMIADNLIKCNLHFRALAGKWAEAGRDPRHSRVKVACRFCRIAYQMVAGRQVFHHPGCQNRHYILDKLITFHHEHETQMLQVQTDLQSAVEQLPRAEYETEAAPLAAELKKTAGMRGNGPQLLGKILPVLAKLGVTPVQSPSSGETDLA